VHANQVTEFVPILGPPDRIPPQRFNLGRYSDSHGRVLDCRNGRVLLNDVLAQKKIAVCDPISGEQRLVVIPSELRRGNLQGAVLCAAAHRVHADCHSSPFKVALVSIYKNRPLACVFTPRRLACGAISYQ
jgi:hypothetical protein